MKYLTVDAVVEKVSLSAFGKPLITNVLRGQVAEAIVALALEPEWRWCSADYSGWDFENGDGVKLEVKQSAAKQSWATSKPSKASFDIAARTGYWLDGVTWVPTDQRIADIYVLAYHGVFDDYADHRDPYQWQFYVVPSRSLPPFKRLGLVALQMLAEPVAFEDLACSVARLLNAGGR